MKSQLLITATGQDRPGIVARITAVLIEHGANLEDSRMALLGGEFAAIMLVSVEAERVDSMSRALGALASEGITVSARQTAAFDPDRFRGYLTCELTVSGADHEGIVHEIARFLKDQSINIQSMDSKIVSAPVTGTPLFCMRATVQVPPALSISDLRRNLTAVGDKESVDIELIEEPVASPRA
jgi:glycine cleavage system transcriptional repressor